MKRFMYLLFCSSLLLLIPTQGEAYFVHPAKDAIEVDAKTQKKLEKAQRKEAKVKKRMDKLEKKLEKKGIDVKREVWDDTRFRYGVLLLGAAIVLGILSALLAGVGVINFIAGIFALGGVILMIWSLVEYYG